MVEAVVTITGERIVDFLPGKKGPRIAYEQFATFGVMDTLSRHGWSSRMEPTSHLGPAVARVLVHLAHAEAKHPHHKSLVSLSLVARRLCVLAAYCLDPTDRVAAGMFLRGQGCRRPSHRTDLPASVSDLRPLPVVREDYLEAFLRDLEIFWLPDPLGRGGQRRVRDEAEESAIALYTSTFRTKRSRSAVVIEAEDDDEPQVIEGERSVAKHAGMCLAGDLLAKRATHADLSVTVMRLVSTWGRAEWGCLKAQELASWAVALIALQFGIAPVDSLQLRLDVLPASTDKTTMGVLDLANARLLLSPGNGYDDSLCARIPSGQILEVQLAGSLRTICELLNGQGASAHRLKDFVLKPTLDCVFECIRLRLQEFKPAGGRSIKTQIGRLHSVFAFVGLVHAGVAPAHLALIAGRTFGPWRADSNYIRASRATLQQAFDKISESLGILAGISMTRETPQVLGPPWVGAAAPPMAELVESIDRMTGVPSAPGNVEVPLALLASLAACRPGADVRDFVPNGITDHPYCVVLADKNLGVGPRSRLVAAVKMPMLPPLFDSTAAVPVSTALGFPIANAPRKAVLTALAEIETSQLEMINISEHADNSLLAGGPLCPIPTQRILQGMAKSMEAAFDASGITAALDRLTQRQRGTAI